MTLDSIFRAPQSLLISKITVSGDHPIITNKITILAAIVAYAILAGCTTNSDEDVRQEYFVEYSPEAEQSELCGDYLGAVDRDVQAYFATHRALPPSGEALRQTSEVEKWTTGSILYKKLSETDYLLVCAPKDRIGEYDLNSTSPVKIDNPQVTKRYFWKDGISFKMKPDGLSTVTGYYRW